MHDVLIVGAGLSGAVCARQLTDKGYRVLVLEQNETHGGNCRDEVRDGCLIHKYGIHIFHTNDIGVWSWISKYGEWKPFTFRAMMDYKGEWYSTPFNMHTFSKFFGTNTPEEAKQRIAQTCVEYPGDNAEAWCLKNIGAELYWAFVHPQMTQHWGVQPYTLPQSYISRIPVRFTYNTRYFDDTYEYLPLRYNDIFDELLEGIEVRYNMPYTENYDARMIIYTGSLDDLFQHTYGTLPYRTLEFTFVDEQSIGTHMLRHDANSSYYRRIDWGEVSRDIGMKPSANWVSYETARAWEPGDIRMYPVRTQASIALYEKYKSLLPYKIKPLGRLGSYQYMDMHQVIAQSLAFIRRELG